MREPLQFDLVPLEDLQLIKGISFPAGLKYRQLLVTGPPGCGKTRLINKIGGWPEEGYIDLTLKGWWRAQALTLRPREVHLGFPFVGCPDAITVFDKEWLSARQPLTIDYARIHLPPPKRHFLSTDWRGRYVFEFLLPPPESILRRRIERSRDQSHPVDEGVTIEEVKRQRDTYLAIAVYFHRSGMLIYVRDDFEGIPKSVKLANQESAKQGTVKAEDGRAC